MATKKTATVKQYVVVDGDGDILGHGTWDEVIEALDEFNDGDHYGDEIPFGEWIAQCTIYELGVSKKLKYTPSKYEMK